MAFPRQQIESAIRDEIRITNDDRPVARGSWEPEVDSHVLVRIALRIEEDFSIELPDDCMPPGGIESIEQCVETVTARCEQIWLEKWEKLGATLS